MLRLDYVLINVDIIHGSLVDTIGRAYAIAYRRMRIFNLTTHHHLPGFPIDTQTCSLPFERVFRVQTNEYPVHPIRTSRIHIKFIHPSITFASLLRFCES